MWHDLSEPWKEAFKLAWEAYTKNTIPIGAVIVDSDEKIVAKGRNRIFDETSSNPLAGTYMAHAEMTAMMSLKANECQSVKGYKLYTTMEPCPMCFGAMVMVGIRNLSYAAKDGFAGATEMNEKIAYIKSKNIIITKESSEFEAFQIILQTSYECIRKHERLEDLLEAWSEYCKNGVKLGKELYKEGYFDDALLNKKEISVIYDEVINRFKEIVNI